MQTSTKDIISEVHPAPAFHYIIFNQDSIISQEFDGSLDIASNRNVDQASSFHAFSTTKTFTAVAVMQLVEQGRICLDDEVQDHLPEFQFSGRVTVRNLLSHQSGIANPLPLKWTHLQENHETFDYSQFEESIIIENLKLKFSPGKKFSYSNINYLVLGKLIEKLSGKDYRTYVRYNIFDNLATNDYIGFEIPDDNHATGYHANTWFQNILLGFLLDKNRSLYEENKEWNGFHPFYLNGLAYGGIISSPSAMMSYCQSLLGGSQNILQSQSIDTMLTEQLTSKNKSTGMCLGWFKGIVNGKEYYCHAGGGGGYYSEIRIYPDLKIGSVIMTNSSGMTDERLLDKLDSGYLDSSY